MKLSMKKVTLALWISLLLVPALFTASSGAPRKTDDELRKLNQATVERWFKVKFVERVDLVTDDASINGAKGKAALLEDQAFNARSFPDWSYSRLEVYSTQDPNKFFVVADGSGVFYKDGNQSNPPAHYENNYIFVFTMQEGKVKSMEEHAEQLNLLKAMGITIPQPMPDKSWMNKDSGK